MRHFSFGLSVVAFLIAGWLPPSASAQETKSARGTVEAIGPDFVTIKAGTTELKFMVDPKTVLTASGAGTAERRAEAAGKAGPRLADFLKAGDAVEVRYQETAGALRASDIRHVRSSGPAGGSLSDQRPETATGTVESLSGSTLTIAGSVAGGSFKQSFSISTTTKVVAVGASTAAGPDGRVEIARVVGAGDEVVVTYQKTGDMLHAMEVRVRRKK